MTPRSRHVVGFAGWLVVATMPALVSRHARASDHGFHIEVSRAPEARDCPDGAGLAAAVERARRSDGPDANSDVEAPLGVAIDIARNASGYVATVTASGARTGVRTLTHAGPTCESLAKALVVSLVVLLDEVDRDDAALAAALAPASASASASTPASAPAAPRRRRPLPPPRPPDDPPEAGLADPFARTANNSFFLELGGNALFYSLNFEHIFGASNLSLRAGFGYIHLYGTFFGSYHDEEDLSVPIVASYYLGGPNHKLQLGAGVVFVDRDGATAQGKESLATLVIGYRYLPYDGGFNFGVAFTPFFSPGPVMTPSGGVSFGVGF